MPSHFSNRSNYQSINSVAESEFVYIFKPEVGNEIYKKIRSLFYADLCKPLADPRATLTGNRFHFFVRSILQELSLDDLKHFEAYFKEKCEKASSRYQKKIALVRNVDQAIDRLVKECKISVERPISILFWQDCVSLMGTIMPTNLLVYIFMRNVGLFTILTLAQVVANWALEQFDKLDGLKEYADYQEYVAHVIYGLTFLLIAGKCGYDYYTIVKSVASAEKPMREDENKKTKFDFEIASEVLSELRLFRHERNLLEYASSDDSSDSDDLEAHSRQNDHVANDNDDEEVDLEANSGNESTPILSGSRHA